MNTLKKLFYATYAVVALVIIGILFFNVSLAEMFGAEGVPAFWQAVALILLSLLTIGVIGDYAETRSLDRKVVRLTKENTDLKAKMYDKLNAPTTESGLTSKPLPFWKRFGWSEKEDLANRPETDK
ncbi:MAG: hypothetical protein H7Z75_01005 [Ferruginibacter sp.]|nr:hypothetical protein [Cytophagales bacterium]